MLRRSDSLFAKETRYILSRVIFDPDTRCHYPRASRLALAIIFARKSTRNGRNGIANHNSTHDVPHTCYRSRAPNYRFATLRIHAPAICIISAICAVSFELNRHSLEICLITIAIDRAEMRGD